MKDLRPFQIVLLILSIGLFIGAIVFLSIQRGGGNDTPVVPLTIWGVVEEQAVDQTLDALGEQRREFSKLSYKQIPESEFVARVIDALAENAGPDLLIIPHDLLVTLHSKLYTVSSEFYPPRQYTETFIEGADIFTLSDGIYAFPFAVDPLVMYWNRDIFSSNGFALPPTTWEEIRNVTVPTLAKAGSRFEILQSGVAFGEYRNVRQAKEMLSLLMLQSGSQMTYEADGTFQAALNTVPGQQNQNPATTALTFYTTFANPASALYSWNRSLPEDRSRFLAGDLALYFDYASEYEALLELNPNLNFAMTLVPQGATAEVTRNFGRFYGVAIPKATPNISAAYTLATTLASSAVGPDLARSLSLAPVTRAANAAGSVDPIESIRLDAALTSFGWWQPSPTETDQIFTNMVEDVTSGRQDPSSAVSDANARMNLIY